MPTDDLLAILALFGVAAWLLSLFRLLITKLFPLVTGRFRFRRNSGKSPTFVVHQSKMKKRVRVFPAG